MADIELFKIVRVREPTSSPRSCHSQEDLFRYAVRIHTLNNGVNQSHYSVKEIFNIFKNFDAK